MKKRKRINLFIGLMILLLAGTMCTVRLLRRDKFLETSDKSAKVELSFFLRKRETIHIFEMIVDEFNRSQDGIVVRTVVVPNPDVDLKMRAIDGEFPDIVEMIGADGENLIQYIRGGYLASLEDNPLLERVLGGAEEPLQAEGKNYLIPLSANFNGLFLNSELMSEAGFGVPQSYEELLDMFKKIRHQGELPIIFSDKDIWTLRLGWNAIDDADGGNNKEMYRLAAEQLVPLQQNAGLRDSLEKYIRLREFGQKQSWETGYDEAIQRFASGEAYAFMQGNWAYSAIKKQNPDIRLIFIPFPSETAEEPHVVLKPDSCIALSSSCENPEEAGIFLDYLLSEDVMRYYTENAGAYSFIRGANGDLSFADAFIDKIEKGEFTWRMILLPASVMNVRDKGLLKLVAGQNTGYTIPQFLDELDEVIRQRKEEVLDCFNWGWAM